MTNKPHFAHTTALKPLHDSLFWIKNIQCFQVKHFTAKYNTPELIFLIPTRTHEQALFFAFFERIKHEGGVGREIRPSSVARVSRFSLAFAHLKPCEKNHACSASCACIKEKSGKDIHLHRKITLSY